MNANHFTSVITRYESIVRERGIGGAAILDATIEALDSLQKDCAKYGSIRERGASESTRDAWYTRFAAALTRYITAPEVSLSLDQVYKVTSRRQTIDYCFSASGYRGMSHLIGLAATRSGESLTLAGNKVVVLLAFLGLDAVTDELMDQALAQPCDLLLPLMLGWLNTRAVFTDQGERNRTRLLEAGHLITAARITDEQIAPLVNAWMYSSYAETPNKHQIKRHINTLLRDLLPTAISAATPTAQTHAVRTSGKPHLLVIHERFASIHAMYRCYAPSIRLLKKYFKVTAMVEEGYIDAPAESLFDDVAKVPQKKNITDLVAVIGKSSPDMIYYPSLGMSHWTVVLAQLRLAPVQIMTHGHPATSMSDTIDYVYVGEMQGDVSAIHSEITIVGPGAADFDPHIHLPEQLPRTVSASNRGVRIAVNSKVMKLSPRLIKICERLATEASVPVSFSFFPGERGLFFDGIEAAIKSKIPSADVVKYTSYEKFLSEICKCDFALAAFPFGNTNSTVDTSLLGMATVAHFGPEAPAQSDAYIIRSAGLAEWLICHSDEDYFQTAMRLIENPDDRRLALNGQSRENIRANLFSADAGRQHNPFADIFWHIYNNHDKLSASSRRVYHFEELLHG